MDAFRDLLYFNALDLSFICSKDSLDDILLHQAVTTGNVVIVAIL